MEQAYYQPLLLLYYWCSKSFWRRQAEVVQLLIEMLYFIHFGLKKHRVWYKIPWSWSETCFQYLESFKRSQLKWRYHLILRIIFLHISLSDLLMPCSQPHLLSSRSSILQGGSSKRSHTTFTVCYRNSTMGWCLPCAAKLYKRLKNRGLSFGTCLLPLVWYKALNTVLVWGGGGEHCPAAQIFLSCVSCSVGCARLC